MPAGLAFAERFFASGHAADLILLVLIIESLWLRTRGWMWREIAGLLGPAVFIVLGLRSALVGAPWYWTALLLGLSLPVHLIDVKARLALHKPD